MLHQLAERVGLTLAVAPHNEEHVQTLCRHLSALIADDRISGLGSGRRFTVPVSTDANATESSRVLHALENHQGDPLHHLGNDEWDFVAFTAPEQWVETTEETLSAYAPVVDTVIWDRPRITVCGFVFPDGTAAGEPSDQRDAHTGRTTAPSRRRGPTPSRPTRTLLTRIPGSRRGRQARTGSLPVAMQFPTATRPRIAAPPTGHQGLRLPGPPSMGVLAGSRLHQSHPQ